MQTTTTNPVVTAILAESEAHKGGTFTPFGQPVTTGIAVTAEVLGTVAHLTEAALDTALDTIGGFEALGTWYDEDNGQWEISRTVVYPPAHRDYALADAAKRGERYVYDLDADECVAVS